MKDPQVFVREAAAEALGRRSALLKDSDKHVRSAASKVLGQQAALPNERFYDFLLKLDSKLFNNVYSDWLGRSFSDYLTWYVKGDKYSINLSEGGRDISFDQLQNVVQEAQVSSKVPILQQS
jgi:hypothetical protein